MNQTVVRLLGLILFTVLVFSCTYDDTAPNEEQPAEPGDAFTADDEPGNSSLFPDEQVGPALFPPARKPGAVVVRYGAAQPSDEAGELDEYYRTLAGIRLMRDAQMNAETLSYLLNNGMELRFWWTNVVALDAQEPAFRTDRLRIGGYELVRIKPALPDERFIFFRIADAANREDVLSVLHATAPAQPDGAALPVFMDAQTLRRVLLTGELTVQTPGTEYLEVLDQVAAIWNGQVVRELRRPGRFLVSAPLPGSPGFFDALAEIRGQDWVKWAEPDLIQSYQLDYLPNDPYYHYQWHLENTGQLSPGAIMGGTPDADVDATAAWDTQTGSSGVTIAIVDTGVQCDHPDFTGRCDTGYDFIDDDPDASPVHADDNHGTACAGKAAAHGNNALGVAGICYDCRVLPVKISKGPTWASDAILADAIEFAADNAEIVSCSWGGGAYATSVHDAIIYATTQGRGGKGVPVFFSTGNDRLNPNFQPWTVTGLTAGTWTIRFEYRKDAANTLWEDAAFVDSVLVMNGNGTVASYNGFATDGVPAGWTECPGSDAPWTGSGDPNLYYGGVDVGSIKSGAIDNSENSCIQFTATTTVANGYLYFRYFCSSSYMDKLLVTVDSGSNPQEYTTIYHQTAPGQTEIHYPSRNAEAISVGASGDTDLRSPYSQYGPELDFVAPSSGGWAGTTTTDRTGADGYNDGTDPDDIADASYTSHFGGTSSACPLAAGIAGLLLSEHPDLTAGVIRQIMRETTDQIGPLTYWGGRNDQYGWGRVNAYKALHSDYECFSDPDCDNGVFCDGVEPCVGNSCGTSLGNPCTATCLTGFCNEALDQCYVAAGLCYIDEACVAAWDHNPGNPCLVCDPSNPHVWTADDAASCDDGEDCTHTDHCAGGTCVGTTYSCDDGKSCTRDSCNGDNTCSYSIRFLTCLIGLRCYDRWEVNPDNPCQECRDDWGSYYQVNWGYDNAATCSDDGQFCTTVHSCLNGSCVGTGPDPCNVVCGTCNETTDHCDNVPGPCEDLQWCNGTDTCENGTCSGHSGNPCNTSGECEYCDEEEKECTVYGGVCSIDGQCYNDGDPNPANECEYCAPAAYTDQWTARTNLYPCDDGLYCNGADRCGSGADCGLHDGNPCDTQCQSCNEGSNSCDNVSGACTDGLFCNGTDTCSGGTCSVHAGDPCDAQCQTCSEGNGAICENVTNGLNCTDDLWCNGSDWCFDGACTLHMGSRCPDDGVWCNGTESCIESTDQCISTGAPCDDATFCNGTEECVEATQTCTGVHSGNPCDALCQTCNEAGLTCDNLTGDCDDGVFCNGADTCSGGACSTHAGSPCDPLCQTCNEAGSTCDNLTGDCDDGLWCNGTAICQGGACVPGTAPCVDDGLECNGMEECWEVGDEHGCNSVNAPCEDWIFCNGTEECIENGGDPICTGNHSGDPCVDDGLFCNGDEWCDGANYRCMATGYPCGPGEICNEETDDCDQTEGCVIEGVPYDDGDFNPANACEYCDVLYDPLSWSPVGFGESCDDGLFCNGTDTCGGDDGDVCESSGDPCGANQTCNETGDVCEDEGAVCGNGIVEPGEDCEQDSDCAGELVCVDCSCAEMTGIELVSFEAESLDDAILLSWETAAEPGNAGFHLWRSRAATGDYQRITGSMLPAQGNEFTGASYEWTDGGVEEGATYFYKLEDIDFFGVSTFHGPVEVAVPNEPLFGCGD